jgi:2-phosphoglycerate kinase
MGENPRIILIGGTSNIGKSTVAQHLAVRLGYDCLSTDGLARYPGRPWPAALIAERPHVAEHYGRLDQDALVAGQLAHYQTMWPLVEDLVRERLLDRTSKPLVLEGSGIWPDNVPGLRLPEIAALWLTGSAALIEARIHKESGYDNAEAGGRALIDKFILRSLGYDRAMMAAVRRLGLPYIEVTPEIGVDDLACLCLVHMRRLG